MALQVELVSPEAIVWSGEANMVIARTLEGDAAYMEGHIPTIAALATGVVRVLADDAPERQLAVHSGFIEVAPGGTGTKVAVLSDMAELAEDIDVARAEAAKARAEEALRADDEDAEAKAALRRAETRIAAAASLSATR
ncbi:MAG: ATP synthase F1 subunit epsilon [Microthrixaceae bacterium]